MCNKSSAPSAPAAPVLPPYPGLSDEEKSILQKQGVSLDQLNSIIQGGASDLAQNQGVLKQLSGLYDENGNLNQDAVSSLKTRVQGEMGQRTQLGQQALGLLSSFFDQSGDQTQTDINNLESTRYLNALKGNLPVSEGLTQQQQKDFELLKESAGQRGIRIEGDSPEAATSESTAGSKMISEFNKRYDLAKANERQSAITQGAGQNLARLGLLDTQKYTALDFASNLAGNAGAGTNAQLGFLGGANASSPATLAPLIENYSTSLGALAQPYAEQRLGAYNQATNQVNASYSAAYNNYLQQMQSRNSFFKGLGALGGTAGTALLFSHPAVGAGVLGGTAAIGALS